MTLSAPEPSEIRFSRSGEETILESSQWIPRPIEEVFQFFSLEANLETLTPPFLNFRVTNKSPGPMTTGTLIDYRLKVRGIPVKWRTRIESWEPGKRFVDTQLRGPYALWHHTHEFFPRYGGTFMTDRVRFRLPLGRLGELVAGAFVRRDVRMIFEFRRATIERLFPPVN